MVAVIDSEVVFKVSIFGLFLGIMALVLYLGWRGEKKRREALSNVATELGMVFVPKDDALRGRCSHLSLFQTGGGHEIKNVIFGDTQSVDLSIFDYSYTTGSGKNRTTHRQTVAFFEAGSLDLPGFNLSPENIFHRVAGLFGYQDINFDSHPKFSKQYLLRGNNETRVRSLFREDVLDYFDEHPGLCVEGSGHQLLVCRRGHRVKPEQVRTFLEEAFAVYNQLRVEIS